MTACLALNASYEPLTTVSARRAVRLILDGKAELVEHDPARPLRSARQELPYPVVIRLKSFVYVPRRFRRRVTNTFLFARDRYTCQYCGRAEGQLRKRESLTRDHVLPVSRGGADDWLNCVTACSACNWKKDDRTPDEAGMTLRARPAVPHFVFLQWSVRRLTGLQRKYVAEFYGAAAVAEVEELAARQG
jgi:5-methylcytosine-specific restriction endonuclease McrA